MFGFVFINYNDILLISCSLGQQLIHAVARYRLFKWFDFSRSLLIFSFWGEIRRSHDFWWKITQFQQCAL